MMKITTGKLGPHFGWGFLKITALASLALGIALTLTLTPGSAVADGQDELIAPIDLEEGRIAPVLIEPPSVPEPPQDRTVVEPPIVLAETRDAPKLVQRQVTVTETTVVLVGNNSKSNDGTLQFNRDRGQAFTTGSNSAGYKLTSVEIESNVTLASVANWAVSIASDGNSGPGSTLSGGHLTEPAGLTTGISNSFTSTNGVDLAPNTTYFVLMDLSAENSTAYLRSTTNNGENNNPATGWSIGNGSYTRVVGSTGTWGTISHNMKIRINGYAKTAPAMTGATVNGTALVITFDKALDTTSGTAAGQFTILAGGTSHAATGLSISGNQVRLTGPAVTADQSVWVSYTKPTSSPLKGTNGGVVDAFSNQAVTNNTAPTLTSAAINGATLDLYFNKALDTTSGTAAGRFTIEVGGSSHAATGITIYSTQIRLTVPAVVKGGQFVTVSYRKTGSNPLKGIYGTSVDTFSKKAVTNNTPGDTGSGTVRDPIIVTYTNAEGRPETVEIRAASADRETLLDYFEDECRRTGQANRFGNVRYCASHKLYVRQSWCGSEDWRDRNPHLLDSFCPTYRTW